MLRFESSASAVSGKRSGTPREGRDAACCIGEVASPVSAPGTRRAENAVVRAADAFRKLLRLKPHSLAKFSRESGPGSMNGIAISLRSDGLADCRWANGSQPGAPGPREKQKNRRSACGRSQFSGEATTASRRSLQGRAAGVSSEDGPVHLVDSRGRLSPWAIWGKF